MRTLQQVLFVILTALLGFVAGGMIGSTTVRPGDGLAGGAAVFMWGIGGLVLSAAGAAFLVGRMSAARLRVAFLVVLALTVMGVLWIGARVAQGPSAWSTGLETPLHAAQRYPMLAPSELPAGLGIASVTPVPGAVLNFYGEPSPGDVPDAAKPVALVRFTTGVPSVDIAEAPPWFVPEHLKMDYELLHLRVLTLSTDWVEVIGNSRTGETWWVKREDVHFASWPEHLLTASSVEPFSEDASPIRARPVDDSPILATTTQPLPPLAVRGDWLQVSIHHLADRMPPEGWIRWRRGDRLLVSYSPLS